MLADNEIVVISCSSTYIPINKKHNYIYNFWFRGAVASCVIILEHIPVEHNPDDILVNNLFNRQH